MPSQWHFAAEVVIAGAGATGLAAAVQASGEGASVIAIDENIDVGGHAILSSGRLNLGGGTSLQKKFGIVDSPDLVYKDWVNPALPEYRYNDRELIRAWADENASTFEWLVANGVKFPDVAPSTYWAGYKISAPRHVVAIYSTTPSKDNPAGKAGAGYVRPLEWAARKNGVRILLRHRLTRIIRHFGTSGRVIGISARNLVDDKEANILANKGVIIATGGHSSNVNFRRIFDPRLTEEYQVAGEPYSFQNADGELAAMEIGASLYGTANQTTEFGLTIMKPGHIGCQYGYSNLKWVPESPYFHLARASGLTVSDWQDVILVNHKGVRFYDETQGIFTEPPSTYGWIDAAMGCNDDPCNGGGPIWAIFDSDAVQREKWNVNPPEVDLDGWFFEGETITELAAKIKSKYQKSSMPPDVLEETVKKYNSYIDAGADAEFNKPTPKYKIQSPPFYAAWATPIIHDSRSGLRINGKCQVIDNYGNVIPSLYCAGESAGGTSIHGLTRCIPQGRIAAKNAIAEPSFSLQTTMV